jgi:hypothetical protein
MNSSDYATVQDALVRMVVPMRREFGVAVDVPRMRVDVGYARFIVAQALNSQSQPLREHAALIDRCLQAAAARQVEIDRGADSTVPAEEAASGDSRPPSAWIGAIARIARRAPVRPVP